MRVGIVGATGIVGRELLMLLAESTIEVKEMRLSASPGSVGKRVSTHLGEQAIIELNEEFFAGMDLCFFCVSGDVSRRWVPVAAARGVMCIDNSSAFRMLAEVPIVVPEVNGDLLRTGPRIVANPNCCVAQWRWSWRPSTGNLAWRKCISAHASRCPALDSERWAPAGGAGGSSPLQFQPISLQRHTPNRTLHR